MKTGNIIKRYVVLGLVFGLLFPLVATYVHSLNLNIAFSLANFIDIQANTPLLWFVDFAPLAIVILAYLAGWYHKRLRTIIRLNEEIIESKTTDLRRKNRALRAEIDKQKNTEKQLILAKEDAERAKKAEELFLANMSHELRTPLNAVVGFARLMLSTNLDKTQNEYINTIQTSANHLLAIISDILEISKIKAGEVEFEEMPLSPTKVIMQATSNFKFLADQKELAIEEEIDNQLPPYVLGDQTRLSQILLNLIGNAVKFTEEGKIVVRARLLENKGNRVKIQFEVEDTGIGISREKQKKIFEKFKQAEVNTTRSYGGTGLGLAICKEMVELQNGSIWVESDQGKGATFYFQLTFKKASTPEIGSKNEGAIEQKDIGDISLLLVEDNRMNVKLAENVFKKWGNNFQFSIANNGKEAIELLEQKDFDVILMDLQMPVMDGFEATRHIRFNMKGGKSKTPIIALTADVMLSEKTCAFEAGIDDYMTKPFDANKLFSTIVKVMK